MGEKRTLELVAIEEKLLNSGKVLYKLVTKDAQKYECWESKVKEFMGKGPQEFEVYSKKSPDGQYTNWYIDLKEPGQRNGGGGKSWGGGKPYQVAFGQTAEGEKLRAKTMLMSYAKDLAAKHMEFKPVDFADMTKNVAAAFTAMIPLLSLDQVRDPKPAEPQPAGAGTGSATGNGGNGHKSLATLAEEMKPLATIDALRKWWSGLSEDDQKTIVAEKDKKKAELEHAASGRKPNF